MTTNATHKGTASAKLAYLAVAGLFAVASLLGGLASRATATPRAKPAPAAKQPTVQVQIRVIHASRSGRYIDKRIRKIQQKLKKLFKFLSYRLVKEEKLPLPFAVETRVRTPFRAAVRLTQNGISGGKIKLRIRVGRKQTVNLRLNNGGTFLQGITLKNGQSYILAVTARKG